MKKAICTFIFATLIFTSATYTVHAQAGSLDLTFGIGGQVSSAIGSAANKGCSVAIQTNGKIVVAGYSNNGTDNDFAVVRYNSDGTLDNTFSSDGIVTTDFGSNDMGHSVAIQTNGKILVAGRTGNSPNTDFALVRYNTNGTLDNNFGVGGKVTTDFGSGDNGNGIAIQPNGKIVVVGDSGIFPTVFFAIARYNPNGTLDITFNGTGKETTPVFCNYNCDAYAKSVTIQPDGKIIVGGNTYAGPFGSDYSLAMARYNSNGTLDSTFSGNGIAYTNIGSSSNGAGYGVSLALQTDGKIIVGGSTTYDFVLIRYKTNGMPDSTFGVNGKQTTDFGYSFHDTIFSIALQSDGKIIAAGTSSQAYINSPYVFAIARYNTDGTLDLTFNGTGKVTNYIPSTYSVAYSSAIQADGKLVVAGYSNPGYPELDFAVERFGNCAVPTSQSTSNITSSGAKLNWITTTSAVGYQVRYRQAGTTAWTIKNVTGNYSFKNITGLLANTAYQWNVRSVCNINPLNPSPWSSNVTFTTLPRLGEFSEGDETVINLYPNPASDKLEIQVSGSSVSEFQIQNMLGMFFTSITPSIDDNGDYEIDVSALPSGVYLLTVVTNNKEFFRLFVKE